MPSPRKGESQASYLNRCISVVMGEGKRKDVAVAQCISMYKQAKNKRISKSKKHK
jgi:hypothetical protein